VRQWGSRGREEILRTLREDIEFPAQLVGLCSQAFFFSLCPLSHSSVVSLQNSKYCSFRSIFGGGLLSLWDRSNTSSGAKGPSMVRIQSAL
jgi:hypothetical protein